MFRTPFPIVYARDVERSVAFYCAAFGFEVTFRWPAEGELDYAFLRLGEHAIGIGRSGKPLHGLTEPPGGPRFELCIYTDDTDAADSTAVDEEEPSRIVVREKTFEGEPMTLDEALFQMELVGHDFFLFADSESGRPSVVYRRKGYDYGVIRLAR